MNGARGSAEKKTKEKKGQQTQTQMLTYSNATLEHRMIMLSMKVAFAAYAMLSPLGHMLTSWHSCTYKRETKKREEWVV